MLRVMISYVLCSLPIQCNLFPNQDRYIFTTPRLEMCSGKIEANRSVMNSFSCPTPKQSSPSKSDGQMVSASHVTLSLSTMARSYTQRRSLVVRSRSRVLRLCWLSCESARLISNLLGELEADSRDGLKGDLGILK